MLTPSCSLYFHICMSSNSLTFLKLCLHQTFLGLSKDLSFDHGSEKNCEWRPLLGTTCKGISGPFRYLFRNSHLMSYVISILFTLQKSLQEIIFPYDYNFLRIKVLFGPGCKSPYSLGHTANMSCLCL